AEDDPAAEPERESVHRALEGAAATRRPEHDSGKRGLPCPASRDDEVVDHGIGERIRRRAPGDGPDERDQEREPHGTNAIANGGSPTSIAPLVSGRSLATSKMRMPGAGRPRSASQRVPSGARSISGRNSRRTRRR